MDEETHIFALSQLNIEEEPSTLIFSWGGDQSRYHARKVNTDTRIDAHLLEICKGALRQMQAASAVPYSPEQEIILGEVGYAPLLEIQDRTLIELISEGPSLDSLGDDEWDKPFKTYSIVFGPAGEPSAIFVRRSSPMLSLTRKKGFFGRIQEGRVIASETPTIQLSDSIDLLIVPGQTVFFWKTSEFEMLFKTEEYVLANVGRWIREGVSNLVGITVEVDPSVEAVARRRRYDRSRWHAAARVEKSADEWQAISSAIKSRPPGDKLEVVGGTLRLNSENADEFLGTLVEDNFTGEWSGTRYKSLNKRRRP